MSTTFTKTLRATFAAVALFAGAATADAKPRRLVVQDFEGPSRKLVDAGHGAVLSVLGDYDLVSPKRWEKAHTEAANTVHGPAAWAKAARTAGVDCVIEGWVNDEGRRHQLTLKIIEATTGNQIDLITVKLGDDGLTPQETKALGQNIEETLAWCDSSGSLANPHPLPAATPRKMLGAKADPSENRVKATHDEDTDTDTTTTKRRHQDDADDDQPVKRKSRVKHREDVDTDDDAPPPPKKHRTRKSDTTDADDKDKPIVVAAAEPDSDNSGRKMLVDVFTPPDVVIDTSLDVKPPHKPVPTPKWTIEAGTYYQSRQLEFTSGDQTGPMEYNGTGVKGLQVTASVYPWPLQKYDGRPSGVGFSATFAKSIGSTYTFDDGDTTADYTIDQSLFEAGVHYRWPLGQVSIDTHASYGRSSHIIQDAPEELEVPDVSYEWIGMGADLELAITDKASVALGGSYMYMLNTGDLTSEDWYGSGSASGLEFHGSFTVPLPYDMFVKGQLTYRRITTNFNGDGTLTQLWGVVDATDTSVGGAVNVGVQF
jgi:hypothetical protein